LTSDGSRTYTYDADNRLAQMGSSVLLSHDAAGWLSQVVGAANVLFDAPGGTIVSERDGYYALLRRYVHGAGGEPLVWYEGTGTSARHWLHADERGSVIALSNDAGTLTNVNSYDEYGIPGAANAGRFQYTGQAWLGDLGMYYYRNRIYSPTLGRFLQTDPIGFGGGMNIYAYVHNDPINHIDPSGTSCALNTYTIHIWSNGTDLGEDPNGKKYSVVECTGDSFGESGPILLAGLNWGTGIDGGGSGAPNQADIQQCTAPARVLAGNARFIGRPGGFGATIRMGSAAIIPRQFGAPAGTASMPPWMVSIAPIIHGWTADGQSFMGVTDVMADSSLGRTTLIQQDALMARDPGLLLIEIEGGTDAYTTATIPWPADQQCPGG
jgi:RHS repeat-associated protein